MMIIYFLNGLSFEGLGLAAYLQIRHGDDFPLGKQLPWLAAFGFVCGVASWIDMFLVSSSTAEYLQVLNILRMIVQPLTGLLLLRFGWGILNGLIPLPAWTVFIPGVLLMPVSYVITYAATTFVTPSPIEIPIDIWSRYLLYLPGSIMAGIGFIRQWDIQRRLGISDAANLMLGSGIGFLFEAVVVGLIVPAAPYGPASYYNYDRVIHNAFIGEQAGSSASYGLMAGWLDYERVLAVTGFPIQFWRMLSAFAVTFFVVRGLGVFDAVRKRQLRALQEERDRAQKAAFEAQITARQTAESWTDFLVNINRRITELEDVDTILLYIVANVRRLLNSDFAGLAISEEGGLLELKCSSDDEKTEMIRSSVVVDNPIILRSLESGQAYRSVAAEAPAMLKNVCLAPEKSFSATAVVRLDLDTHPFGVLWIARLEERLYSETDLVWLECVADQVVITIQHGLMTAQLQSLSITEERARIAREMHDGLAQVLGYLNLQVQTLEALLKQNKQEALLIELGQMREAVRVANADIRENILSLRTTLASKGGLASALGEYLEEFGLQTGIETCFVNKVNDELNLSSVAEVQLVCILQEALANVRKHSHAQRVEVRMTVSGDDGYEHVQVQVLDNGIGFLVRDSKRSFGLQTMRERAESVQGSFSVTSVPGAGTSITCRLPSLQPEQAKKRSVVLP